MSDEEDEYEYEYDDDAMSEDGSGGGDQFEYTDEEEEHDDAGVALENAYYNAKGLRETDLAEAAEAFEQIIPQEREELAKTNDGEAKKYGPWSYKAMKQLVKLHLRAGNAEKMMEHYRRLLECISEGDVSPNAVEKGINGMLERVASLYQGSSAVPVTATMDPQSLALQVYDATLAVFHPITGCDSKNERLWFKTNLKYGQLLYEMNETVKLQQVLKELKSIHNKTQKELTATASEGSGSSTQSMEIYALQIQLYSRQKDNKKLRETFNKAMSVRGGIPHPRTLALIQELGGKMHMAAREYEAAGKTFFSAFKSYDEAGDPSRLRCLKYLVLASMLHASSINPFDSQEARPYRDDPEITAMTDLVQAFHNNEIQKFERILRQNQGRLMKDEFVREHVEDLLRTIRTQVLRRVLRPYTRISLAGIARELNDIPLPDVERLLVSLILDGSLDGKVDRVAGVLIKKAENSGNSTADASAAASSAGGATGTASPSSGAAILNSKPLSLIEQKCNSMDEWIGMLENLSTQVTSQRVKETVGMRGMVH